MLTNPANTIDLEIQAQTTLALLSNYPEHQTEWDEDSSNDAKRTKFRILEPIKNFKPNSIALKSCHTNSSVHKRSTLIPSKVRLDNQEYQSSKPYRISHFNNGKENLGTLRSIRKTFSFLRQGLSREREEREIKEEDCEIDFREYWIRHRFENGAVSGLMEKMREGKKGRSVRF